MRKGKLEDISKSLIESFVSRNNDLDGYWAIGKLYKHAVDSKVTVVSLNLLSGIIVPESNSYKQVAQIFRSHLTRHLRVRGARWNEIRSAIITLSFRDDQNAQLFRAKCGDPYVCKIRLEDTLGRIVSLMRTGYCLPHDPARESSRFPEKYGQIDMDEGSEKVSNVGQSKAPAERSANQTLLYGKRKAQPKFGKQEAKEMESFLNEENSPSAGDWFEFIKLLSILIFMFMNPFKWKRLYFYCYCAWLKSNNRYEKLLEIWSEKTSEVACRQVYRSLEMVSCYIQLGRYSEGMNYLKGLTEKIDACERDDKWKEEKHHQVKFYRKTIHNLAALPYRRMHN